MKFGDYRDDKELWGYVDRVPMRAIPLLWDKLPRLWESKTAVVCGVASLVVLFDLRWRKAFVAGEQEDVARVCDKFLKKYMKKVEIGIEPRPVILSWIYNAVGVPGLMKKAPKFLPRILFGWKVI